MINAGIGESQMNNILAYINLPTIAKTTLKKREREIGSSITAVANDSCTDAINEEIALLEDVNRYLILCTTHTDEYSGDHNNNYYKYSAMILVLHFILQLYTLQFYTSITDYHYEIKRSIDVSMLQVSYIPHLTIQ